MHERSRLLTFVSATVAVRTAVAASAPLIAAEAYYWLWNRHLAAGYIDHPPMVAVLAKVCLGWVDGSEVAARSGALLTGGLAILAVHALAREMFPGTGTAWRAALLFAVTPIFAGLGIVLEPDNTLILFTVLTWWAAWRAMERRGTRWWLLAGVFGGGALLSKFHAWVLLPPLVAALALSPRRRPLLRTPGPWIAVATALAVLSPNLWWNAQHAWANYAFQWRRSAIAEAEPTRTHVHVFLAGALVALSPALAWTLVRAVRTGLRRARDDDRVLFLLAAGLPLPLLLGLLSLGVKISVHWPSAGYVALLVLVAHLAEPGTAAGGGPALRISRWAWGGAVAITAIAYAAPFVIRHLPAGRDENPGVLHAGRLVRNAVGWPEIAAAVHEERAALAGGAPVVVFATKWSTASMLAFYTGLTSDCFALEERHALSFEAWRRERGGLSGASAVVVFDGFDPNPDLPQGRPALLRALFETAERRPRLVVRADGTSGRTETHEGAAGALRVFEIWRCRGFRGAIEPDE